MSIQNTLKNICTKLGKNNKPTYVVMAIATVKGICRPMFTMMDKKENPDTKKYTAIREGLTEVIAIPAYFACGEVAAKLAKVIGGPEHVIKRAEKNLMFVGVCVAALFLIPALCSVAIKPLMAKIQKKNTENKGLDLNTSQVIKAPVYNAEHKNPYARLNSFSSRPHFGMKVGSV